MLSVRNCHAVLCFGIVAVEEALRKNAAGQGGGGGGRRVPRQPLPCINYASTEVLWQQPDGCGSHEEAGVTCEAGHGSSRGWHKGVWYLQKSEPLHAEWVPLSPAFQIWKGTCE